MNQRSYCIGIVGLGLIGGSIARCIRRVFPETTIIGYDVEPETLKLAEEDGTLSSHASSLRELGGCDYIFLCAPVHYNIEYLPVLKECISDSCILTDAGSVKSDICKAIQENSLQHCFIGGHPMVGSERSGYEAATDRLIENAYYFLTPPDEVPEQKIQEFRTFLEDLGAIPIVVSPERHDEITAYISHIPHVIAAALVNLAAGQEDPQGMLKQLAAGGFKDITRIASSNPVVWEHILLSNPEQVSKGLYSFIQMLEQMTASIKEGNARDIYDFFDSARSYRNSVPDHPTGVIHMNYEVYVDIPDEPGALAQAVSLLGAEGINLKNVGITHNREDDEGVLRLCFYDNESAVRASALLRGKDYQVYDR